ncbi:ABC transporter ATP-binding protein [Chelativorans sp. Marseille-P2723]|uniref:ABC transporter ATP-binding protein n=1 Tax=Chelativorans sp. Marseille-P2723 TaxID=2709133 RepID=UPI00156EDA5E|nr:ABC transporter ATP-binding protein [Chelativorans sp. Marseille-P2723]
MRLEVGQLDVSLSGRQVLRGAGFSLSAGEVVGLLGPNGAGKSTLMRALAGLVTPSAGSMRFGGEDLAALASAGSMRFGGEDLAALDPARRARILAYLPQTRTIGWRLSVRDVVSLGRLPWRRFGARPTHEDAKAVEAALKLMDIAALANRPATELSGGEQARVLAARAVAQATPLLVFDEPASGLDPAHQIMMMEALRRLGTEGRAVFVSLHDLTLAARWCDRVVMLKEGRLVAEGAPHAILTAECLSSVYGVKAHIAKAAGGMILVPTGLTRGDTGP